jgi:hypothetical protein
LPTEPLVIVGIKIALLLVLILNITAIIIN